MESFDAEGPADRFSRAPDGAGEVSALEGRPDLHVEEVHEVTPELIAKLVEIDLQTFSESTFSEYAAASMLRNGRVYLLWAQPSPMTAPGGSPGVIGTCVTMRCWDRPNEAMVLSMGIKPGWRGQGLGQRFIFGVLDKLKQRGLRSACLYVGSENRRAIKVYEDVGFRQVEKGPRDAHGPGALMLMRAMLQDDLPVIELP